MLQVAIIFFKTLGEILFIGGSILTILLLVNEVFNYLENVKRIDARLRRLNNEY